MKGTQYIKNIRKWLDFDNIYFDEKIKRYRNHLGEFVTLVDGE